MDSERQAAGIPAEERKTETTLTTRVRINIPGSRPIPPVVMRTPMSDVHGPEARKATDPQSAEADGPAERTGGQPATAEERTSDWFAPRKTGAGRGAGGTSGVRPANVPPAPGGSGAPGATSGGGTGFGAGAAATGPVSGGSGTKPVAGPPAGGDFGPDGPGAPASGGSYDDPYGGLFDTPSAMAGAGDDPFDATAPDGDGARGAGGPPYFPDATGRSRPGPAGPTNGPMSGDSALGPVGHSGPAASGGAAGERHEPAGPPPRLSDDTAVLTPQKPAPEPADSGEHISGHTLTSGIPVVPAAQAGPDSPFPSGGHTEAPVPHTPPKLPDPGPSTSSAPAARKKGRSKPVLLAVLLVAVAGVAYGAGLLVNHSDVPKGTTVLGVDIGGGTRDEAVKKLDTALGDRTGKPLTLAVDGGEASLRPDQAGLKLDTDATVQAAARSDYNPVSVIGSLFGGKRVIEPVMPVDEEKLHAALERAAGGSGSAKEGTIRFEPDKAIAVYGKEGKAIDIDRSITVVEEAYRVQVETGRTEPVPVTVTTRAPAVSKAEVDRMMKEFARPAMSGIVTITAGNASIPFGPAKSLPQILGVKAVDGKLVDTYDREALKKLYGNVFDGVLITRGNGKKTPVQPEDVVSVMRKALLGKTPEERIGVIDTDPS